MGANADRRRFFAIARPGVGMRIDSGLPEGCNVPTAAANLQGKTMVVRIVLMIATFGRRSH